MELTNRDKILFAKLQTYGHLTTRLVGSQVFPGVRLTTVLRRLRKLESDSYIQRIAGLQGYEVAWALTEKGALQVGEVVFKRHFRRDVLGHDLKLVDLRLRLEGSGLAHLWTPEHEIRSMVARRHGLRAMKDRVVPDGLMGIRVDGCAESVAVELELHFKNQRRYYRTFREYQNKSNIWAVWYVVATKGMGESLERFWRKTNPYNLGPKFRWSLADDVLSDPLQAWIYSHDTKWRLQNLWEQKPAQTPALEVSRVSGEIPQNKTCLATENRDEILAPAS